jgi:hypothetical protein
MSMAYLNPMSLMTIESLTLKLCEFGLEKFKSEKKWTFFTNGIELNGDTVITINNKTKDDTINDFLKPSRENIVGLEILKNIIAFNDFDLLEKFYNEIFEPINLNDIIYYDNDLIEKYKCSTEINHYTMAPFEGYYINENIIGLLSTLLDKLGLDEKKDFVKEQDEIYLNNKKLIDQYATFRENLNTELICQTYFFREFIRYFEISDGYGFKKKEENKIKDAESKLLTKNKKKISSEFITCHNKKLEYWIKDTYDYNKAYIKDNPPISIFLAPYFDSNIINNFYVFYVVSNMNNEKCEKQIKLIADTKEFLERLKNFDPINYKENKGKKIVYTGKRLYQEDINKINKLPSEDILKINNLYTNIEEMEKQEIPPDIIDKLLKEFRLTIIDLLTKYKL